MSAPIGPGDWVECIAPCEEYGLRAGAIYCVEEVAEPATDGSCQHCSGGCFGVLVSEAWLPVAEGYWCGARFRPIYRPKSSIIEQLKQPAPDVVRELIVAD
jgi:hypothetical protein